MANMSSFMVMENKIVCFFFFCPFFCLVENQQKKMKALKGGACYCLASSKKLHFH
jgi:hypothetical protein